MTADEAEAAPAAWKPRGFRSRREFAAFLVTMAVTLAVHQSLVSIERVGVTAYLVLTALWAVALGVGWRLWRRRLARH
ncbi:hypothetical protein [Candidatus Poriferisodalis sp.]|uniref:hypothetical protein n=1 Tax=Candidatus Poriferisodalis sp. TaxID=3101277 RepID=UPI003C6F240F